MIYVAHGRDGKKIFTNVRLYPFDVTSGRTESHASGFNTFGNNQPREKGATISKVHSNRDWSGEITTGVSRGWMRARHATSRI